MRNNPCLERSGPTHYLLQKRQVSKRYTRQSKTIKVKLIIYNITKPAGVVSGLSYFGNHEVYNFRQTKQKEGESLDSYHTRLRQLVKTCEFTDVDKEIKEHIVLTCTSSSLRRRALRENFSLEALLKHGRALELSNKQAKDVEKTEGDVSNINSNESDRQCRSRHRAEDSFQPRRKRSQSRNCRFGGKQDKSPRKCGNCGGYAPHKTRVQCEEKPVRLVEKLVILLMFADQNLELWPP